MLGVEGLPLEDVVAGGPHFGEDAGADEVGGAALARSGLGLFGRVDHDSAPAGRARRDLHDQAALGVFPMAGELGLRRCLHRRGGEQRDDRNLGEIRFHDEGLSHDLRQESFIELACG